MEGSKTLQFQKPHKLACHAENKSANVARLCQPVLCASA